MDDRLSPGEPPDSRIVAMSALLARNWWAVLLRGIAGILFGLVALALPGITLYTLLLLFAAYMLADGLFAIISGIRAAAHHERWSLLLLEGVLDLAIGLVAAAVPGLTLLVFVSLLAAWALISGIALVIAAFRLHATHGRFLLALSGFASIVWGALLFAFPAVGAVVLTWWLGIYALVFGVLLTVLGFRLRQQHAQGGAAPLG
ncbi:MAG TPA: HdeD family acid-resistance protein [Acetobacteraceae bacterium]|nr:HdeD family acid-resistance protein [Acetobacteraceae bacterium]